jgi:hypothetical protein
MPVKLFVDSDIHWLQAVRSKNFKFLLTEHQLYVRLPNQRADFTFFRYIFLAV